MLAHFLNSSGYCEVLWQAQGIHFTVSLFSLRSEATGNGKQRSCIFIWRSCTVCGFSQRVCRYSAVPDMLTWLLLHTGLVHTITRHSLKTHFNIIPAFLSPIFPSGSSSKVPTHISDFFHTRYVLSTSVTLQLSPKHLVNTAKCKNQHHVLY